MNETSSPPRHHYRGRSALAAPGFALLVMALLIAVVTGRASAHGPSAAFSGVVPQEGVFGLLVTGDDVTRVSLMNELDAAGCSPEVLAIVDDGEWEMWIPGGPDVVNERFPETLEAATPFFVRCAAGGGGSGLDVRNVTITIDGRTFTLANGRQERPIIPGAAAATVVQLAGFNAYGDLDDDGATDVAFVLSETGASSIFYYVSAITADGVVLDPVFLGDRIRIRSIEIVTNAHELRVSYLTRWPHQTFASGATVLADRSFVRDVGTLVPAGCTTNALSQPESLVFVTSPASGAPFPTGSRVEGCSRTFESTVNWELYDSAGAQLASGSASGGGVDGREPFSFLVRYHADKEEIGRLEVFESDISGEGSTPARDIVPVVLSRPELEGRTWRLASLAGGITIQGTEIFAFFAAGVVTGSAGCNDYGGTYLAAGDSLTLPTPLGVTLRTCEQTVSAQEQSYLAILSAAVSSAIRGDTLTIQGAAGELVFTAETVP